MSEIYNDIPTWDNGTWTVTNFDSREEFRTFILTIFDEPGKYKFNEDTNNIFNEQARLFRQNNIYCAAPFRSKDFIKYWDNQKENVERV